MTFFEMKINKIYSYNIDYKYNRSCLMTLYYTYIVYVYMYSLIYKEDQLCCESRHNI